MNSIVEEGPHSAAYASYTTPSQLLTMAVQQGADLDRLERLMDLQQKWEANEARKHFAAALAAFKSEAITLVKTRQVSFTTRDGDTTSYRHAELACVASIAGSALAKHDLSFRWDVHQSDGRVTVDCILTHASGHSERVTMSAAPDGSGKKNPIQQVASTVTYLERYTLLAITGMAAKDSDDDAGSAYTPEAPREQAQLAPYPRDKFEHNLPKWADAVKSGKLRVEDVIARVNTKGVLSEEQRCAIADACRIEEEQEAPSENA